jgi:hypothetical protein
MHHPSASVERLAGLNQNIVKAATRADSFAGQCYLFIDLAMRDLTQDATHGGSSPVPAYKARKVFGLNISKAPVSRME